jgi:arylsulfotransferase ASST
VRAPLALVTVLALAGCSSATGGTADPPVGKAAPRSLSGITPPHLTVTHPAATDVAPRFVFVGEKGGKDRPSGPVIADNQGRIVWYHEVPHGLEATDFRTQTYKGKPVLTWWQGTISKAGVGRGEYYYLHVNSVSDAPGGNILISGRNTSTIYLVGRDGHIVWRLGGKRSDFGPPKAVFFRFQHYARLHDDGTLSMFDNGGIPKLEPFSRALVLKLDAGAHRAAVVKTFVHPQKIASPFEGNSRCSTTAVPSSAGVGCAR